ncbi:unnamed protein product [Cuscuta campestris]|uniref:non-specific serine/threonine protein kinase n=1 Tax=Cuscuta campestris TaxID=132261 RepID=A0A484LR84_9ASTE|nr:unnamed protein product [Cuscuta campestris]
MDEFVFPCVGKGKFEASDSDVVEVSPNKRYLRYNEILGSGASKTVYKGFDETDGIGVAWNQVHLDDALQSPKNLERLYTEIHLLRSLKHENIIKLHCFWVDNEKKTINMITELFCSGSMRQFRKKHKVVDIKAIKKWARQILQGLHYLHSQNPPVIHRDVKCDNIFINGNSGEVKIGDFGLATMMMQPTARSVVGTAEFMAPELYDEEYDNLADIYSFGMCLLELITCECPYSECINQAQIFKKVTSGKKPAALDKVKDLEVKQFIEKCLVPASQRASASELLKDSFLSPHSSTELCYDPLLSPTSMSKSTSLSSSESLSMDIDPSSRMLGSVACAESKSGVLQTFEFLSCNEKNKFKLEGEKCNENSISLHLHIAGFGGNVRKIDFPFYPECDTGLSIAGEMVEQLELSNEDVAVIADRIDTLVLKLIPNWKPSCTILGAANISHDALENESKVIASQGTTDQIILRNNSVEEELVQASLKLDEHEKSFRSVDEGCSMVSFASSMNAKSGSISSGISCLSVAEKGHNEDALKREIDAFDMKKHLQHCRELVRMRESTGNCRRKWLTKRKICRGKWITKRKIDAF